MARKSKTGCSEEQIGSMPSFFVVGPPRTGTSWLHEILSEHTVLPSPTKETRFFDLHFHLGADWYRDRFPQETSDRSPFTRPVGEVGPTYFSSPEARQRIAALVPAARIVCIFRDPAERMFSLYRLKRAYGMIPWTFEQAIARDPELLESGRYATHLKEWLRAFGPDQVMATFYEDLRKDPQEYVDKLSGFIGIPKFTLTPSQLGRVHTSEGMTTPRNYYLTRNATGLAEWLKTRKLDRVVMRVKQSPLIKLFLGGGSAFEKLSPEVKARVRELLRTEVEELEAMLDRDLSAWKSAGTFSCALPVVV
jgi:hypothetical protein